MKKGSVREKMSNKSKSVSKVSKAMIENFSSAQDKKVKCCNTEPSIVSIILLIIILLIILIVNLFVAGAYYYDIFHKRDKYARLKCEEQKKACSENFKNKADTKYKTAVLNTPNVVKN